MERQQYHDNNIGGSARVHFGNVYNQCERSHLSARQIQLITLLVDASSNVGAAAEASCRKALFLTDPSIDRQRLIDKKGLRVANTCEWIQDNETYKSWLHGEPGLLWIFGGPGKGKTMLAIHLTQQLERWHNGETIYFFCSSEHSTLSTATAVMRTLLWQITVKRPELTHLVSPHFDPPERTQAMLSTPGSLWEIFTKFICTAEHGIMHCIIDGLDECDDESARWLASRFAELSREDNNSSLRVLIVSRFMSRASHIKQIHLDPDNDHNVSNDITRFTTVKVQELSEHLELSPAFCERIQAELLRKAGGTFLWIGHATTELLAKKTSSEVNDALYDLPVALPALYARMLQRLPSKKLTTIKSDLHWVALAIRPLSLIELADAINWPEQEQTFRDFVEACQPFLSIQHEKVVLVHQSARDYLLREIPDHDAILESVRITRVDEQLPLAKRCIDVLGKFSPLHKYACSHWPEHMRRCSEPTQLDIIHSNSFFSKTSEARRSWWAYFCLMEERRYIFCKPGLPSDDLSRLHIACYLDLKTWVLELLSPKWYKIGALHLHCNRNTRMSRRPLHYAILEGGTEVVPLLLANGARTDAVDHQECSPIWYATVLAQEHNFKLLLDSLQAQKSADDQRRALAKPLTAAIELNNVSMVSLLLKGGADVDGIETTSRSPSWTTLQVATANKKIAAVQQLLDHGADPRKTGHSEQTEPIYIACYIQCEPLVKLFIAIGVDPNIRGRQDDTLLEHAIRNDWEAASSLLLAHGADPNKFVTGKLGTVSVLCIAIELGQEKIVDELLDHGAETSTKSEQSPGSPLLTALTCGRRSIVPKLIERGALPNGVASTNRLLWTSILYEIPCGVDFALRQGADPNTVLGGPLGGFTALHWAVIQWRVRNFDRQASKEYVAMVKCLLQHGADPKIQDARGKPAEQYAVVDYQLLESFSGLVRDFSMSVDASSPVDSKSPPSLHLLRTGGIKSWVPASP